MGFGGVWVSVQYPILDPKGARFADYLEFYKTIARAARDFATGRVERIAKAAAASRTNRRVKSPRFVRERQTEKRRPKIKRADSHSRGICPRVSRLV